jgi:hypothetical protein
VPARRSRRARFRTPRRSRSPASTHDHTSSTAGSPAASGLPCAHRHRACPS